MTFPLRVLIVEDEMMIAMLVEDMLRDLGHEPIGPATRLDTGIKLAMSEPLDLAILASTLAASDRFR
jgi:DNA-binding response OmpR family regulator